MLEIRNLHARVSEKEILQGIDLPVKTGEVHAIMGPNGSGKSTLAQVLAGRDLYQVTEGEILYEGKNLIEMSPEDRAREGVFMAFQYPVEIPGVSNLYFLKAALNTIRKNRGLPELDAMDFLSLVKDRMKLMEMDPSLMNRPVNAGFSGGEKKRNEIFQMAVLEPRLEYRHLKNFVPLFLAAGKPRVDRTIHQARVHLHQFHPVLYKRKEIHGVELRQTAILPD